jgi:FkbM family methyltransferase
MKSEMKVFSRLLLGVARRVPRGYWRLIRFAAKRDEYLQDLAIGLRDISLPLRADLRESVFVSLYLTGQIPYQIGFDRVCRDILRRGDIVFDVGANVGYTAALFSDLVGDAGRVLAIEPSPRSFFLLSRSFSEVANIKLVNLGVSSEEGNFIFYVPAALNLASFKPIQGASRVEVHTVTLDSLTKRFGQPTFIKVDVEGHEPDVFMGAAKILAKDDRPFIIFEALNPDVLKRCCAILTELSAGSYRFLRIVNNGTLIPIHQKDGSSDYLAIPPWAKERLIAMSGIV